MDDNYNDHNYKVNKVDIQYFVYELELEGIGIGSEPYHYIGITQNLNQRWTQHILGKGSEWTKLHKPVKITNFWTNGTPELENKKTYELINKYGIDKVRGGVCHCPKLENCRKFGCVKSENKSENVATNVEDYDVIFAMLAEKYKGEKKK